MNQRVVKRMLPVALAVLEDPGICMVTEGTLLRVYRGVISSMGAAMVMSSFKAAVVFYADGGDSNRDLPRAEVLRAVHAVATATFTDDGFRYQLKQPEEITAEILPVDEKILSSLKESYINAAIALKQAMNVFSLV